MTVLTLTFLSSCNVKDGCDIFGLPSAASDVFVRIRAFREMDLATLSMFIAAGADMNERINDNNANSYLLFYALRASPHDSARISLMRAAGADVNAKAGPDGFSMLHHAVQVGDQPIRLSNFMNMEGVSINITDNNGRTPLDLLALIVGGNDSLLPVFAPQATTLRARGGVCLLESSRTTSPAICGTE